MGNLVVHASFLLLTLVLTATAVAADDCNANGIPDDQEIAWGTEADCNLNTILDVCETEVEFENNELLTIGFGGNTPVVADLDGDGDLDVAGIEFGLPFLAKVHWFENLDGEGTFGTAVEIWGGETFPLFLDAADLNGDDDVDLLFPMFDPEFVDPGAIAWLENLGSGTFSSLQIIATPLVGSLAAAVAEDVDGDGDQDIVAALSGDRVVVWYENLDGLGSFGLPQTIWSSVTVETVLTADIDGDGDPDVVTDGPTWFENSDGAGTFVLGGGIAGSVDFPRSYAAADIDGDRDVDVIFAGDEVGWQENEDGAGDFGLIHVWNLIDPDTDFVRGVTAADFDADGDNDVMTTAWGAGGTMVAWYENLDGYGTFGEKRMVVDHRSQWVVPADVDGDGDIDAVSSSSSVGFNFHRNLSDDCNGNRSPDECETFVDCNLNGIMDSCDLALRHSFDCDNNVVPDECEVACPSCDADGDDCVDVLDCAVGDPSAWSVPGEVTDVAVTHSDFGVTTISWSAPFHRGSIAPFLFDALISPTSDDFVGDGSCLATNTLNTSRSHFFDPVPGQVFHFLIRAGNDCGEGSLGSGSAAPRDGVACP